VCWYNTTEASVNEHEAVANGYNMVFFFAVGVAAHTGEKNGLTCDCGTWVTSVGGMGYQSISN
jgi:hypothetical protein